MGHLINPISYRLYYTRYWNNVWNLHFNNINYSYLNTLDYFVNILLIKFFNFYASSIKNGIMYLNLKIIRAYNRIVYNIYIHDSFFEMMVFKTYKQIRNMLFPKVYFSNIRFMFAKKACLYLNRITRKIRRKKKKIKLRIKCLRSKRYKKSYFTYIYKTSLIRYYFFRKIKRKIRRISFHFKLFLKYFLFFIFNKLNGFFWNFIKLILHKYLSWINLSNKNNKSFFYYNVFCINRYTILSKIVSDFIAIRLTQKFKLGEILSTLNRFFYKLYKHYKLIHGYKIQCSGRFSRKQRASLQWKLFFSIKPSTLKSQLDYSVTEVILRFGKCAIKVWIRKTKYARKKILYKF